MSGRRARRIEPREPQMQRSRARVLGDLCATLMPLGSTLKIARIVAVVGVEAGVVLIRRHGIALGNLRLQYEIAGGGA